MSDNNHAPELTPDPALQQLDRFVGTWRLEGNLIGSDKKTIKGQATYRWLSAASSWSST